MTNDLGRITNADITVWRCAVPRAFGKPFGERLGIIVGWSAFAALIVFCLWYMDFMPQRLWQGIWKLG